MKNTPSRPGGQDTVQDAIVGLLSLVCTAYGHTFSWYTSKKQRVWLQFKGFSPTIYTTAVELPAGFSAQGSLDAFEVLLAKHLPKLFQDEPPLTTWLNSKSTIEARASAREYCGALFARYLAGESFLPDDYPSAPLTDPDGDADA